jgi:hypothetical protein
MARLIASVLFAFVVLSTSIGCVGKDAGEERPVPAEKE